MYPQSDSLDPINFTAPCPHPECGCPGCSVRCAGCGISLAEWAEPTSSVEISQRPYCDDCAPAASDALADAVLVLLRAGDGRNIWEVEGHDASKTRMNAALHITRPATRSAAQRIWPSSVPEVLQ